MDMWCLGTWFSGGLGSLRFMVGLNDVKDLFQPKRFYDSKQFCDNLIPSKTRTNLLYSTNDLPSNILNNIEGYQPCIAGTSKYASNNTILAHA